MRPSGAFEVKCKSWDDFIQKMRLFEANRPSVGTFYRGHSNAAWKLSSAWERLRDQYKKTNPRADARKIFGLYKGNSEDDLFLSIFKEQIRGMPEIPMQMLKTKEDWWAFGRHFGLITPFLDWSQSPFIAVFFALQDRLFSNCNLPDDKPLMNSKNPVVVWRLRLYKQLKRKGEFTHIHNARYEFHRQRIQLGSFTHLDHSTYTDLESYLESRQLGHSLFRYEIPCSSVEEVHLSLADLDRMNIHSGTVFPDPQGAATYANHAMYWFPLGLKAVGTSGGSNLTGSIEDMDPGFLEEMLEIYED